MRSPGEIRTALIKLRDEKHLPYCHIEKGSRCSRQQIYKVLRLEATEEVLRRMDAYLDAHHLHVRKKSSELLYLIENLDREMYCRYGLKNLHILTVQEYSPHQQRRLYNAMQARAKKELRAKAKKDYGIDISLPDGLDYWQCRKALNARVGAEDRLPRRPRR